MTDAPNTDSLPAARTTTDTLQAVVTLDDATLALAGGGTITNGI